MEMETNPDVQILAPLVAQIEKRFGQNKNKNRVEDDILGYIEQKHIDAYERLFLNPKYDSLTDILSPYIYMEQDRKNRELYNSAMRLGDSMLKQANQNLRSKFANVKRSTTNKNILKVVTNTEAEHNASMREHDAMMRQHMAKMGGRRKTRQYAGASKQEVAQKMLEYKAAYAELKHARELRAAAPQKFRMVDPQTGLPKYTSAQQETIRQGIKGKIEAAEEKFYRLEAELKAMNAELSAAQAPAAVVAPAPAPAKSWMQRMFGKGRKTYKKRGVRKTRKHRGTRKH
jgi:hypothetical protein